MDPVALGLVLAAAAIHAGWNRVLHDRGDRAAVLGVAGLFSFVLLLPWVLTAPPRTVLALVALSAAGETLYALCLSEAYRRGSLGFAYPIGRGTSPLLVTLGAWLLISQRPSLPGILGAACLGCGLILVAVRGETATRASALAFAVLTGLCIAAYTLVDSQAVHHTSPAGYLGVVLGLQGLIVMGAVRPGPPRLRSALRPGLLVALGSVSAYLLVLLALQRAHPGPVSTLRETSVLAGLLLARERPGPVVWAGAGLVALGAVLVVLH